MSAPSTEVTYFVFLPDGGQLGPADLGTLRSWVDCGIVFRTTSVALSLEGPRIPAAVVEGLFKAESNVNQQPTTAELMKLLMGTWQLTKLSGGDLGQTARLLIFFGEGNVNVYFATGEAEDSVVGSWIMDGTRVRLHPDSQTSVNIIQSAYMSSGWQLREITGTTLIMEGSAGQIWQFERISGGIPISVLFNSKQSETKQDSVSLRDLAVSNLISASIGFASGFVVAAALIKLGWNPGRPFVAENKFLFLLHTLLFLSRIAANNSNPFIVAFVIPLVWLVTSLGFLVLRGLEDSDSRYFAKWLPGAVLGWWLGSLVSTYAFVE